MYSQEIMTLALLGSMSPILACLFSSGLNESQRLRVMLSASIVALATSVVGALGVALCSKAVEFSLFNSLLSVKLDGVSSVLLIAITTISLSVIAFSERYMAGRRKRSDFIASLCSISSASSLLALSSNLFLSFVCWQVITWGIFNALRFSAARKESPLRVLFYHLSADSLLALCAAIVAFSCHSLDYSAVVEKVSLLGRQIAPFAQELPVSYGQLAFVLLLLALSVKSALFPFHRWLLATLDGPTPLSCLLHAGVVNVSAIMALRLFPIFNDYAGLLVLWGSFAAVSAMAGTLCMSAQPDVKRKLVFSTVGQMGFMSLQCASGFVPVAIFHLIAHGFFKCHLLMQSASAVSEGRLKREFAPVFHGESAKSPAPVALCAVLLLSSAALSSWSSLSCALALLAYASAIPSFKSLNGSLSSATAIFAGLAACLSLFLMTSLESMQGSYSSNANLLHTVLFIFFVFSLCMHLPHLEVLRKWLYAAAVNGFYLDNLSEALFRRNVLSTRQPNGVSE